MMRTLLYCYRSGRFNNRLGLWLAGILKPETYTCPPCDAGTFPYARLAEANLAYIVLHGSPDDRHTLYGDERDPKHGDHRRIPGLSIEGILGIGARTQRARTQRVAPLRGLIVFLEGCYGAATDVPAAFEKMGAAAVVAAAGETVDLTLTLGRAGWQGRAFVRALRTGRTAAQAAALTDQYRVVAGSGKATL